MKMSLLQISLLAALLATAQTSFSHGNGADHAASTPASSAAHHHDDAEDVGQPGELGRVSRTEYVDMSDAMRFSPARITAKQGETIRFVIRNSGKLKHEFVLGTVAGLKAHADLMRGSPGMAHAEPNAVMVMPGATNAILWRFTKAGEVQYACLEPGHFEAGMKGAVQVEATKSSVKARVTPASSH